MAASARKVASRRAWYERNREWACAYAREWAARNRDRRLRTKLNYRALNKDTIAKDAHARYNKTRGPLLERLRKERALNPGLFRLRQNLLTAQYRASLSDSYVRKVIQNSYGIPCAAIPIGLVEAKRLHLLLKRKLKEKLK